MYRRLTTSLLNVGCYNVLTFQYVEMFRKNVLPQASGLEVFVCFRRDSPQWAMASSFTRFLDHTQRNTTVGRTPLDESSIRRRDLYQTTQNTHNRQTSIPPVGFEPTISVGEGPQTYALDRAATGTGRRQLVTRIIAINLQISD